MNDFTSILPELPELSEPPYDCNDGAVMYLSRGRNKIDFDEYIKKAVQMGFNIFDEAEYGGSFYTTLTKNDLCLHIYYIPAESTLRIIADPYTDLYNPKPESCIEKCRTTLWQFEVDHTLIDCGMCYIIRCCDNSFFIVDSAHNYSVNDHERIYKFLKERTPRHEKTVIAGWFLTHGHEDHVAKFTDFVKYKYGEDVVIEAVYYNFVSTYHRDSHYWMFSGKEIQRECENTIKSMPFKKIKLHSGQHFYIRNLEFRVLCTHEDVYPGSLENFNDSSTMLIMKACGTVVQFPGDAGYLENDVCVKRFGKDELECNIIQVSHHGHMGLKEDFYALANPKVLLFPVTQIMFDGDLDRYPVNTTIIKNCEEYYIASNGTVEIDLPYEHGKTKKFDDETFESFEGVYNLWSYQYTEERKEELRRLFVKNGGDLSKIRK